MAKFRFSIEAGAIYRSEIRNSLQRSVDTLKYEYPNATVSVREEKGFFESEFFVQGFDFPDTDEFELRLRKWERQIKSAIG